MFVNVLISDLDVSQLLDQLFTKEWYTNGTQIKSILSIWNSYQKDNQLDPKYMTIFLERLAKRFVEKAIDSLFKKTHTLNSNSPEQLQQDIEIMKKFFMEKNLLSSTQINEIFEPLEYIQMMMKSLSDSILLTVSLGLQWMN